jgi:hypothetical protein
MPPAMQQGLEREFKFSADDIAKVEAGKATARMVHTGQPDDVLMVGVVLIKTSAEQYLKAFRDIENFAVSPEVVRTKRFSSPPSEADLADFRTLDAKKDILACRPGHCAYKLPAAEMTAIQTGINWNAPDADAKAQALIHERVLRYLNNYRQKGDGALAVYYDTDSPYSVADGLHSLIGSETEIAKVVPQLVRYASEYPANRPPNTEDFFYWQEAAFGLKHVVRTEHVLIQKLPEAAGDPHYAVISKMLFATHYFRAAVEFQYLYPVRTPSGEPAFYLLSAQRSYVDGLTGAKGAIIRKVAEGRSPARLADNLQQAKQRLEKTLVR